MNRVTLDQARTAKAALRLILANMHGLRALGVTMVDGGYAVKVIVSRETSHHAIPDDVDGVPVVVDVVGELEPL